MACSLDHEGYSIFSTILLFFLLFGMTKPLTKDIQFLSLYLADTKRKQLVVQTHCR